MGIITPDGSLLAYCNECGQPAVVLKLRIHGWRHTFLLCGSCLERLARLANSQSPEDQILAVSLNPIEVLDQIRSDKNGGQNLTKGE
jgi:hypothetical protein